MLHSSHSPQPITFNSYMKHLTQIHVHFSNPRKKNPFLLAEYLPQQIYELSDYYQNQISYILPNEISKVNPTQPQQGMLARFISYAEDQLLCYYILVHILIPFWSTFLLINLHNRIAYTDCLKTSSMFYSFICEEWPYQRLGIQLWTLCMQLPESLHCFLVLVLKIGCKEMPRSQTLPKENYIDNQYHRDDNEKKNVLLYIVHCYVRMKDRPWFLYFSYRTFNSL